MRLSEMFVEKWKACTLQDAYKLVENEVENRYGVLSDENKIEKTFFQLDKHGNMTRTDAFSECIELFSLLKELVDSDTPLMELYVELMGWFDGYEVVRLESAAKKDSLEKVEHWIEKINEIYYKKKLILLKEKGDGLSFVECCNMEDYRTGCLTFSDIHVRVLLLKHVSEKIRILIVAGDEERCIEI